MVKSDIGGYTLHDATPDIILDIEMYGSYGDGHWAQAKYLAHGYDDVYWTNDLSAAMRFLTLSIQDYEKSKVMPTIGDDL